MCDSYPEYLQYITENGSTHVEQYKSGQQKKESDETTLQVYHVTTFSRAMSRGSGWRTRTEESWWSDIWNFE